MVRNALIAGATGLVGNELVSLLIKSSYYSSVHILTRRPYHIEHTKIISHLIDFENINEFKPDASIHDVYICLGTTMKKAGSKANFLKVDSDYVLAVARWALQNNSEKLAFISSVGANSESSNFYLSTKGKVEKKLSELAFSKLVILRPSFLVGKRNEFRLGEKIGLIVFSIFGPLFIGKLKRYRPVKSELVAKAMFRYLIGVGSSETIIENEQILNINIDSL